jgi:hypothetical protein
MDDLARAIRRPVVDDEHLAIGVIEARAAGDRLLDVVLVVVCDDDYGQ